MWIPRILFFVILILASSGCSGLKHWRHNNFLVGPNHKTPAARVAGAWLEAEALNAELDQGNQDAWWHLFDDPQLAELVQTARQENLTLRAAALRVQQARQLRDIAARNLLPQSQNAVGRYTRRQISLGVAGFGGQGNQVGQFGLDRNFDDWLTGFDMSWELDIWGRLRRSVEASQAAACGEYHRYNDLLVTLQGDVASAYVEVRAADQRLQLAEENVRIQAGSQTIAQQRFYGEIATELDVHQATVNLTRTQSLIPALKEQRQVAINRLAVLLGTTPDLLEPQLADAKPIPQGTAGVVLGVPAELMRRRPDIRSAEQSVAQQCAEIGVAEAELYPQFSLTGDLSWNAAQLDDLLDGLSVAGSIAPGFRWKILNYGRVTKNIKLQELQFEEAIANYENTVLVAHQEVEDAVAKYLRSLERVEALQASAIAAERAVALARLQYEEGATDFGQVFLLEGTLVQQQDALVDAQANVAIGLVRIYKALGGGWRVE